MAVGDSETILKDVHLSGIIVQLHHNAIARVTVRCGSSLSLVARATRQQGACVEPSFQRAVRFCSLERPVVAQLMTAGPLRDSTGIEPDFALTNSGILRAISIVARRWAIFFDEVRAKLGRI